MKKMLILGGDLRLLKVASEFKDEGFILSVYGIDPKYFEMPYNTYNDYVSAVSDNDIIIMGLPASKDNTTINTPYFNDSIYIDDIIKYMKGKLIFGGMLSDELTKTFKNNNINIFDYYLREELIIKNVIPTVEGAISIAIEETAHTIHGSRCLVCGFGRIGKLLSKALDSLGAFVTVSARNLKDLAWIECYGYNKIRTEKISEDISSYDIIFNTIPYNILDKECLKKIKKDGVIIDLASKPGGVDFNFAKELGVKTIWALSLPGKTAPHTAGLIIKSTITNILNELGG